MFNGHFGAGRAGKKLSSKPSPGTLKGMPDPLPHRLIWRIVGYNFCFLAFYTIAFAFNAVLWGFVLKCLRTYTTIENLVQLLSGVPALFFLAIVGVKFLRSVSYPILIVGIMLLLATPPAAKWTTDMWGMLWDNPVDVSGQRIIADDVSLQRFAGRYSRGTGFGGRGTGDLYQVFLPLDNGLVILMEYNAPHGTSVTEQSQKAVDEAISDFYNLTPRFAMKPDRIRNGASESDLTYLPDDSNIRVLIDSETFFSSSLFFKLMLLFSISAVIFLVLVTLLVRKDSLEIS